jgi:hypothetical protein
MSAQYYAVYSFKDCNSVSTNSMLFEVVRNVKISKPTIHVVLIIKEFYIISTIIGLCTFVRSGQDADSSNNLVFVFIQNFISCME